MTAISPSETSVLTWDDYLAEGEIVLRYDIVDGVRHYMSAPSWRHQRILFHILRGFRDYEIHFDTGYANGAPLDVLIRRNPRLQTRQTDALFISPARFNAGGGVPVRGPLAVAPELVVEIISDSDRAQVLADRLADYQTIGVLEAWLIRPDDQTVEIIQLTSGGPVSAAVYGDGQTAHSTVFPDLQVAVTGLFTA